MISELEMNSLSWDFDSNKPVQPFQKSHPKVNVLMPMQDPTEPTESHINMYPFFFWPNPGAS